MKKTIQELDEHIAKFIQGGFGQMDMTVMKEECEKLKPGDIHVQIGIDEGRSLRVAHEYAPEGVSIVGIDIHDPWPVPNPPHSIGRSQFMEQEQMVGLGKRCFYVHGDAKLYADLVPDYSVQLLFIDGFHDYDSVAGDTFMWEKKVKMGGVILFHDYDHPDTKKFLDDYYKDNKEILHNKIVRVRK